MIYKQIVFKTIFDDIDIKFIFQVLFNSLFFDDIDYYHKFIE